MDNTMDFTQELSAIKIDLSRVLESIASIKAEVDSIRSSNFKKSSEKVSGIAKISEHVDSLFFLFNPLYFTSIDNLYGSIAFYGIYFDKIFSDIVAVLICTSFIIYYLRIFSTLRLILWRLSKVMLLITLIN